jgi:hypothetical protein
LHVLIWVIGMFNAELELFGGKALSFDELREIILTWWKLQDAHAGLSAFLPIIAAEGFEIRLGDRSMKGYQGLEEHRELKRMFFDESHDMKSLDVDISKDGAEARSVTRWEASYRVEPSPSSRKVKAELIHSWSLKRSSSTKKAVIVRQVLTSFEPLPGHSPIDNTVNPYLRK